MAAQPILLRLPMVMRITGLARSTIYKLISQNQFPVPIKLSKRAVAWLQSEIENWVPSRVRAHCAAPASDGRQNAATGPRAAGGALLFGHQQVHFSSISAPRRQGSLMEKQVQACSRCLPEIARASRSLSPDPPSRQPGSEFELDAVAELHRTKPASGKKPRTHWIET